MGRPRDPSFDRKILDAFRALAEQQDVASITMAHVATESGVSRSAIYRRWPRIAALQFEAQTSRSTQGGFDDLGSFRAEMVDAYLRLVDSMVTGDRALTAGQLGQMITSDAFASNVWEQRWGPDTEAMYEMWQRAIERGEVDGSIDGMSVMSSMVAECIYRVMLLHQHPDQHDAERFVDRLMHGVSTA